MYIRRYYGEWLDYAEYRCSTWGVRDEAYDCLADVLEYLIRMPESALLDMLRHEQAGDKKLFFYVRKSIMHAACRRVGEKARRHPCPIDVLLDVPEESDDPEPEDGTFARNRAVEALFRSDDYTEWGAYCGTRGSIYRYVIYTVTGGKRYPKILYQVQLKGGWRRHFSSLSAAAACLASLPEVPPPPRAGLT